MTASRPAPIEPARHDQLVTEQDLPHEIVAKAQEYLSDFKNARAAKTIRAFENGVRLFRAWCDRDEKSWFPATPATVAAFVASIGAQPFTRVVIKRRTPTTITTGPVAAATMKQYLWAVGLLHRSADLPDPTKSGKVAFAVDAFERAVGVEQRQAPALTREVSDRLVEAIEERLAAAAADGAPPSLYDLRDRALILTWRDTLARVSELIRLRWDDVAPHPVKPPGSVKIRRSKTDQKGQGHQRHLTERTLAALTAWRQAHAALLAAASPAQRARIAAMAEDAAALSADRAVFVGVHRGGLTPLSTTAAVRVLNDRATWAGVLHVFSGHSVRVGTTQDLLAAGYDALAVAQAGGWKDTKMVLRYGARLLTDRSAVAQHECDRGRASGD
ncbi:tyrosine-type recombinase/integrase [Azospirillum doebereinerae]